MPAFLTGAWWLARLALWRGNAAGWLASNAVRAGLIGLAALALIVLGAWGWHALFGAAPVRKQTAEEVVIATQAVSIEEHANALLRAQAAEAAASAAREQAEAAAALAKEKGDELQALLSRPGNRMQCIDDAMLQKLVEKIRGTK